MRLNQRLQRLETAAAPKLAQREDTRCNWAIVESLLTMGPADRLEEARRRVEDAQNVRSAQDIAFSYVPTETLHQLRREIEEDLRSQGMEVPE